MEILFVTSELAPYSARPDSSVADSAAALPKALRGLGHRVTVLSPLYANIDPTARSLARRLSTLSVEAMGKTHVCTLYDGRTTGGVDLVFLANAEVFGARRAGEGDAEQQALAEVVLGAAAAQFAQKREPAFEVIHALGASAAFALPCARALLPELPRVLSLIEGVSHAAVLSHALLDALALPAALRSAFPDALPSVLGAGVAAADTVVANAASGAHLETAHANAHAGALANLLGAKGARSIGIVNGVDASVWNSVTDSHLSARFDAVNLQGKARCKGSLQFALGLNVDPSVPLVVAIGELSHARGGDRVVEIAEHAERCGLQLAALYEGTSHAGLSALAEIHTERVVLRELSTARNDEDDKLRHLALAGADFVLVPAREPRGVEVALCALRYGTLPIARPVGVLGDVLVDADAKLETGNAFLIDSDGREDTLATVQRAIAAIHKGDAFDKLRRRVMRTDVSWERSARRYEHAYKQLRAAAAAA
ncbi:MAG TPA: glycogen/starch synthase [Polyangiales bacterium]|nr:glycogen/starch synthase [Polyangiales bacterium]